MNTNKRNDRDGMSLFILLWEPSYLTIFDVCELYIQSRLLAVAFAIAESTIVKDYANITEHITNDVGTLQ